MCIFTVLTSWCLSLHKLYKRISVPNCIARTLCSCCGSGSFTEAALANASHNVRGRGDSYDAQLQSHPQLDVACLILWTDFQPLKLTLWYTNRLTIDRVALMILVLHLLFAPTFTAIYGVAAIHGGGHRGQDSRPGGRLLSVRMQQRVS